jgi:two-component system cell cycle sensor histidine kinase/response regulator CckA
VSKPDSYPKPIDSPECTQVKRDRYQELFERSRDAILIIEGDTFVECNQAAVEMLRCSNRSEVLATHPSELSPPTQPDGRESFEKANEMIAIARERGSHRFEWNHLRRDGEVFPVEVLLTPVDSGEVPALHVVWRDLSERWRLEEQLRQSQKMEAIGKLAGGIAHDFNNLLVAIFGHCGLIERQTGEPATIESIVEIREAGERAANLVRQLMSFSRHQPVSKEVVNLRDALTGLAPLLSRLIGEDIQLEIKADTDCAVFINPSQFDQIILNLATNARDAMAKPGILKLELRTTDVSEGKLEPGRYALLTVTDTGIGMDAAQARRAFDPFFTTKAVGEGTGFGLSTVYRIATECGGDAHLESVPGEGTSIHVFLPLTQLKCPQGVDAVEAGECGGKETILLVEDDMRIADLLLEDLHRRGYTVLQASNGLEALDLVKQQGIDDIDLIVSDVIMPKMTGPAFVGRLLEQGHNPRVLFISGYTDDALASLGGQSVNLLPKPFTPEQLAIRIRKALDDA